MDGFVVQALTMLGYQLPELLACITGMAMLSMWTSAAPGRGLAIGGMATLLGTAVLRLVLGVTQAWMIHDAGGTYSSVSAMLSVFGAVSLLLSVVSAVGLVMLAWGACKAMKPAAQRNTPPMTAPGQP